MAKRCRCRHRASASRSPRTAPSLSSTRTSRRLAPRRRRDHAVLTARRRSAACRLRCGLATGRLPGAARRALAGVAVPCRHARRRRPRRAHPWRVRRLHGAGDGLVDASGVRHAMLDCSASRPRSPPRACISVIAGRACATRVPSWWGTNSISPAAVEHREPLADIRDAAGAPVAECGSRRGAVTGTFFHVIDTPPHEPQRARPAAL